MTTLDEDKGINLEKRWAMSFIMVQYFVRVYAQQVHQYTPWYEATTYVHLLASMAQVLSNNRRGNKICNALARLRPMTRSMGPKHMGKERESQSNYD